jgi:hypothetical protein
MCHTKNEAEKTKRTKEARGGGVKKEGWLGRVPVVGGYKLPNGLRVVGEVKVYNLSALLLVDDAQRPLLAPVHLYFGGSINPTWASRGRRSILMEVSCSLLANRTVKLIHLNEVF